jgi:urea transporter
MPGYNLKDSLTNLASVIALVGSCLLVGTASGWIDTKYEKTGQGMLGLSAVFTAYAAGKRGDLRAGQEEKPPH